MIGSDWIRTEALDSFFDAFSSREPVSTSLENAIDASNAALIAARAALPRLAPIRPDRAGYVVEGAVDQFGDQQAAVIDRPRHRRPALRNRLEADAAVIGLVANQDDEAMPLRLGIAQRTIEQHATDAALPERRLDRQRPEHQGRRIADADRQLPHRADQQCADPCREGEIEQMIDM